MRAGVNVIPYVFGSVPAFFALYNVCDEDCRQFSELRQNASGIVELAYENRGEAFVGGGGGVGWGFRRL